MAISVKGWMNIFAAVMSIVAGLLILNMIQDPEFAQGIRGGVGFLSILAVQWSGHIFENAKTVKE